MSCPMSRTAFQPGDSPGVGLSVLAPRSHPHLRRARFVWGGSGPPTPRNLKAHSLEAVQERLEAFTHFRDRLGDQAWSCSSLSPPSPDAFEGETGSRAS